MGRQTSRAFDLLHPLVQKWIWSQSWTSMRAVQEEAIPLILAPDRPDVIVASPTASGKTEAAFLPLVSRSAEVMSSSLRILYLSPLKALINDQAYRLNPLFSTVQAPLQPWHGDVSNSVKSKFARKPAGGLLITPESIEAMFVRRGHQAPALFEELDAIVVDEVHAFLGTERGRQVQSLLRRVEDLALRKPVQLIGLSATLGDYGAACEFLRPGEAGHVRQVELSGEGSAVDLVLRGYVERDRLAEVGAETEPGEPPPELPESREGSLLEIGDHLFQRLRGGRHLVFLNSRNGVEAISDHLRRCSERARVPNEFFPHHGNLGRVLREEAETRLREGKRPTTLLATTTLELGIDVGDVESVAQIGPPGSVSGLRQRLGRSGRRGNAAVLRLFIQEAPLEPGSRVRERLRVSTFQATASVELLRERWYEPPIAQVLNLSTLVQQILSTVAQHGSVTAAEAWTILCGRGPFRGVGPDLFASVLRSLGGRDLLSQLPTGELIPGLEGERLLSSHDIYSAFQTPEEMRVVSAGKTLGTLPVEVTIREGTTIIFAGRRWRVIVVDVERKVLEVKPDPGGQSPVFLGGGGPQVHERVRQKMRELYEDLVIPPYLDSVAQRLLASGRKEGRLLGVAASPGSIVEVDGALLVFPWTGDREMVTLEMLLKDMGVAATHQGLFLHTHGTDRRSLQEALVEIALRDPEPLERTAARILPHRMEKFHEFLDDPLIQLDLAASRLDVAGATRAAARVAGVDQKG